MTRFATLVTTKHDINLCGKEGEDATVLAKRLRGKKNVIIVPIISNKHPVYIARQTNGTVYTLDYDKKSLTIKPKKGKTVSEKIVADD